MSHRLTTRPCESCGQEVNPSAWRKGKRRCLSCGLARAMVSNAEQMGHYGETHDKWLASMVRAVSRETSRSTPIASATGQAGQAETPK